MSNSDIISLISLEQYCLCIRQFKAMALMAILFSRENQTKFFEKLPDWQCVIFDNRGKLYLFLAKLVESLNTLC